jgi:hypothetical protein
MGETFGQVRFHGPSRWLGSRAPKGKRRLGGVAARRGVHRFSGRQAGWKPADSGVRPEVRGNAHTLRHPLSGNEFSFDVSRDGKRPVTTNFRHISDEIWLLEPAEKK